MDKKNPVIKNIVDAFSVLDLINEEQEIGIAAISEKLNLPKTTIFRIIKSLEEVNVVQQLENSKYSLGYHLSAYSKGTIQDNKLKLIAEPYMKKIVEVTGESVNLGVRYGDDVIIVNTINGEFYQLQTTLLPFSPLYCSGMGKLYLSQLNDEALKNYFVDLKARTVNTITDFKMFKEDQKRILETGVSVDNEEYEYGLTCYAVPIFNNSGGLICAISISGSTGRLNHKGVDFLVNTLKTHATTMQKEMNKML